MSLVFKKINAGDTVKTNNGLVFKILTIGGKEGETYSIQTLSAELPHKLSNVTVSAIGDNIYIFGGYISAVGATNQILKLDTIAGTVTTLSSTLPGNLYRMASATLGNNIYLFGGWDGSNCLYNILKFDGVSETLTILSVNLSGLYQYLAVGTVNNDAYITTGSTKYSNVGGWLNNIIRFNGQYESVTTLSAYLPEKRSYSSASVIGTNMYIFGGSGTSAYKTILKFDTISNTVTTLNVELPATMLSMSATTLGNKIYIFGGSYGDISSTDKIFAFDDVTETITELDIVLPKTCQRPGVVTLNDKIYIIGDASVKISIFKKG